MKIVYIVQHFSGPGQPGGARPYEACRLLASFGHDVHVITAQNQPGNDNAPKWTVENISGFSVHATPVSYSNSMSLHQRVYSFLRFALRATAEARKVGADVVFASSTPLTVVIPGMIAASRSPFVFEVRDLWPEMPIAFGAVKNPVLRRLAFGLARLAYRRSEHIVALSEGMKDGITKHGVDPAKITVIPNACDRPDPDALDAFKGFNERGLAGRKKMVFVGSMGPLYDLEWALRVTERLYRSDTSIALCLIGTGKDKPRVMELARQAGALDESVFFFDPIPRSHVFSALSQGDMVISIAADVPGIADNSANKFFDGLAVSRPVAVNYGGWQGDLLNRTGAGLSLSREIDLASKQLLRTLQDDAALQKMGAAAGRLGVQQFDREKLVRRLDDLLTEAHLSNPRAGIRGHA